MTIAALPLVRLANMRRDLNGDSLLRSYLRIFGTMVGGAVIVTGAIALYAEYQDQRAALAQLQSEQTTAAASRIDLFFTDTARIVRSAIPPTPASRVLAERRDEYLRVLRLAPAVSELRYVDASGREEVRVSRVGVTQLGTQRDLSAETDDVVETRSDSPYFSPPDFRNGSEPHMTISFPEPLPNAGMTIADVNLTLIWELISTLHVGNAGEAYVVDHNGNLIAHPDISLVLRRTELPAFSPVGSARDGRAMEAVMTTNFMGQLVVATSQPIPSVGWWLVVDQPVEEAFSNLFASMARTALLLMLSLAGGLMLSLIVARRVVRPIQAMQAARARTDHELQIARKIQLSLLPRALPLMRGWRVKAYYQPARHVGGDFYDYVPLPDGCLGLFIGDVSGEGIPAALGMAQTRTILRSLASTSPGEVLARTNELLLQDIPGGMFATCLYAVLEPSSGKVRYANAGHPAPYQRNGCDGDVTELRARGMPLGLMPGMTYPEHTTQLHPGDLAIAYSDGLIEAHNPQREMFGERRLGALLASRCWDAETLLGSLLRDLATFTGREREQEDDLTVVVLERLPEDGWQTLSEFELDSQVGNERIAMQRVAEVANEMKLSAAGIERLKSAVAEAVMNAVEHGNQFRPDLPVTIRIATNHAVLSVQVIDCGAGVSILESEQPELHEKLAGTQNPRGWGLFLIRSLVDEVLTHVTPGHYSVDLRMRLPGPETQAEE